MAPPRIFVTGGTGYIGGSVLDAIVQTHPEYAVTALLRNEPSEFRKRYPDVSVIKGDYDSFDTLAQAAREADVVVHNGDSRHENSIRALIHGLVQQRAEKEAPGFLIHLSGTGYVSDWREGTYLGKLNQRVYSDVEDVASLAQRSTLELHSKVNHIIQDAVAEYGEHRLKTAIVLPPDLYGPGRGVGNRRSVYLPAYCNEIRKVGAPFFLDEGTNTRDWMHIEDLMVLYLKLVEAGVAGGRGADWGREGWYFASSEEYSQIDVAKAVGQVLKSHGRVEDAEPKRISLDTLDGMMSERSIKGISRYLFASNSRTRADRAAKLFGYQQKGPNLWEAMEADIQDCME